MNTYGKSSGRNGNYSTNWQITGRELLDASEVRMLDNSKALLFIRGEPPIMDDKYDLTDHPNVIYTPEKGGEPYEHGTAELSVASISQFKPKEGETYPELEFETQYELLSHEEIEEKLLKGDQEHEKEKQCSKNSRKH